MFVQQLLSSTDRLLRDISISGAWDEQYALEINCAEELEIVPSCLHELVENHARRRGSSTAIRAWDKDFTYSQLNDAADRLAYHLVHACGVKAHDFVHVCFEKSAWYLVSILAINKAGAAWVPLDPSHPLHRQQQVVSQTQSRLTLVSPCNLSMCAGLTERVLEVSAALDDKIAQTKPGSITNISVSPENAAYVLFTSGSTGTPQGSRYVT